LIFKGVDSKFSLPTWTKTVDGFGHDVAGNRLDVSNLIGIETYNTWI